MSRHKAPRKPATQKKPTLTHFLCLPLVTPTSRQQLENSLQQFRDMVTPEDTSKVAPESGSETSQQYVNPKAIRPIGTLHCTLGVMCLSNDELSKAVDCLNGLDVMNMLQDANTTASSSEPTCPQEPLAINLRGLLSMQSPENTSILYSAPTDLTERLHSFCLALRAIFCDHGLLVTDDRPLKLHATIVNTVYAKGRKAPPPRISTSQYISQPGTSSTGGQDNRSRGHGHTAHTSLRMDATGLIEKFKYFPWADGIVLDRIAICEMGAKKITDSEGRIIGEEYTEVASLALPT